MPLQTVPATAVLIVAVGSLWCGATRFRRHPRLIASTGLAVLVVDTIATIITYAPRYLHRPPAANR